MLNLLVLLIGIWILVTVLFWLDFLRMIRRINNQLELLITMGGAQIERPKGKPANRQKRTEEWKKKVSATQKARWAKIKAQELQIPEPLSVRED